MSSATDIRRGAAVLAGIDGSRAAIHAARWAVDEAIARDVPLRLVHVASADPTATTSPYEIPLGVEYAETVLREADAAIRATGKHVEVDTVIVRGDPVDALLAESRDAELICVGSAGIGAVSGRFLGSIAAALAEGAHCPVAIIRYRNESPRSDRRWIAAAIRASTDGEDIAIAAMEEARLRHAPLLAVGLWQKDFGFICYDELDRLVASWQQRYPDVDVHPVTTRSGLVQFLNDADDRVELVVVGSDDAGRVADIVGPHSHPLFGHPESSVLVVRH